MFDDLAYTESPGGAKPFPVKIYALTSCEHCRDGMALLDSLGLAYRYLYVDKLPPEDRIRIKKDIAGRFQRNLLFPFMELPGEEFLFGYDEGIWRNRLLLLAAAERED